MIEIGKTYFYLTPIKEVTKPEGIKDAHRFYLCKCVCGNEKVVSGSNIGHGVKSCGCKRFGAPKTHGYASHKKYDRLYHTWNSMKFRCENPKSKDYIHYGERGISVCEEWRNDFIAFRTWALSHGYAKDLTIDRIDVNGNYEPDNCRWLTRAENNKTKRKKGTNMTIYEIDRAIMDTVDPETGEIVDIERLDALKMERDTKISGVACWIKDLKAENEAIKTEKQNLTRRQEVNDKKMESLKRWLNFALNGEKFKDGRVSISYRRSESVQFSDSFSVENLPSEYIKVTLEPMKSEIKQAIKDGKTIEGCFIKEDNNIQIK